MEKQHHEEIPLDAEMMDVFDAMDAQLLVKQQAKEAVAAAMAVTPQPKTTAEYKQAVRKVAESVSTATGVEPVQCLLELIDPVVFVPWREAVELLENADDRV